MQFKLACISSQQSFSSFNTWSDTRGVGGTSSRCCNPTKNQSHNMQLLTTAVLRKNYPSCHSVAWKMRVQAGQWTGVPWAPEGPRLSTVGDKAFPVAWNSLPSHITAAASLSSSALVLNHISSLSYPSFRLFSHPYSARTVSLHFGHYNRLYI